ncbi:MAG: DNA polymerase III subunit beta [Bacillota bacterium]
MQFTATRENLLVALNAVLRAVPSRSPLEIATCVLVRAEGSGLKLTGTDLEMMIRCRVPALEVYREGEAVVPARHLSEIVRRVPEGKVEVEGSGRGLTLTYPGGEMKLSGFAPEEFPSFTAEDEAGEGFALGASLRAALRSVLYAAGRDDLRPIFTGVQFELQNGTLTVAATDAHRLAVFEMATDTAASCLGIVPAKALREVERSLGQAEEQVSVTFGPTQAAFSVNDLEIYTRLIEGRFPEWRQAVPQDPPRTLIRGEIGAIVSAVERAQVLAHGDTPSVLLKASGTSLVVLSQSDMGEFRETVTVDFDGEEVEIAFNANYLLDALRATAGDLVEIGLNGNIGPAVIRGPGHPGYLALVLPLRLF